MVMNQNVAKKTDAMAILIVEDDDQMAEQVISALRERRSAETHHARSLDQADQVIRQAKPIDAIILDLNLPDGSGLHFARACRQRGSTIPILMLTANDAVEDRVNGLRHGADDYLCKPFAMEELVARFDALMRRAAGTGSRVLRFADIELDLLKRSVRRGSHEVSLSARELDLLAFFMHHPDQVHEKARILREVWGGEEDQDPNLLHVYTNYLRNKLERHGDPRILHTVRGVGYVLSVTDRWS